MAIMYRQGDLLFIKTCNPPEGKERKDKFILRSNMTGHQHRITRGTVYDNQDAMRWSPDFYVAIPEGGADLVHEEHRTIPLPEGIYEVRRQREVTGYVED